MTIHAIGRRAFIAGLGGAAAWPLTARGQLPANPLIGVLQAGSAASTADFLQAFRDAMRQLGYVEGRNVRFEYRFADGVIERLPQLAAELVEIKPDVIVSGPLPANLAIHKATSTIPIVMGTGADPVAFRVVKSLARPGGNVTGVSNFAEELASKQLDIMRELLPRLSRAGVLVNVTNPLHVPQWRETQTAADKAGIKLVAFEVQKIEDLPTAFATFARERVEALLVPPDVTFNAHHRQITELAASARLPAIYFNRTQAENGGLISYGPDVRDGYRRAATYVDKILKGAKPADLPIEQPTKIDLAINIKVAKALGLDIPPTLLARADAVIE
jgi:putative ABC transport system substrate-binding protein